MAIYQKYRDVLTIDDIKDGIEKSFKNAVLLLNESGRFIIENKYSLTYYFLYTAEEEFIKIYLLMHYFAIVRDEGIKVFWKYFTNHIPKKRLMLFKRFVETKDNWMENIYFLLKEKEYQTIRENSLYCDIVSPKRFVIPQDVFEESDCLETARRLKEEKKKWSKLISDTKKFEIVLKYLEKNSSNFISPSLAFKKTHGKPLFDK